MAPSTKHDYKAFIWHCRALSHALNHTLTRLRPLGIWIEYFNFPTAAIRKIWKLWVNCNASTESIEYINRLSSACKYQRQCYIQMHRDQVTGEHSVLNARSGREWINMRVVKKFTITSQLWGKNYIRFSLHGWIWATHRNDGKIDKSKRNSKGIISCWRGLSQHQEMSGKLLKNSRNIGVIICIRHPSKMYIPQEYGCKKHEIDLDHFEDNAQWTEFTEK